MNSKKIILGITGCVAIYKAAQLLRNLINNNYEVIVVMTQSSLKFVKPMFFSSLGAINVYTDDDFFKTDAQVLHINLNKWADYIIIYPITANTISKLALGICDNLLTTIVTACPEKKIIIAPAMNTYMWEDEIIQKNLNMLKEIKYRNSKKIKYSILEPQSGDLACGDRGKGKLINPEHVIEELKKQK